MPANRTTAGLTIALLLLIVSAGCSGGAVDGSGPDAGAAAPGDDDGVGGEVSGPLGAETAGETDRSPPIGPRRIVYTGQVALEVTDFAAARQNLTAAARAEGGFVSDARVRRHEVDGTHYRTGAIVLRVPRTNFSNLLTRIEARGTLRSSETTSTDVTDQLVDVDARLSSLRRQRERLRTLYARANDTEAVLAVERRLSAVQTEIERLSAEQQSLQRRVAYSTITVELREGRPEPTDDRWYDVGVGAAFLASIDGVVVTVRAVSVGLAYALPYLFVFGVPAGVVGVVIRRRRR